MVPAGWCRQVFEALSQPSERPSVKLVGTRSSGQACRRRSGSGLLHACSVSRPRCTGTLRHPLESCRIPEQRFDHVHVDLVGPLLPFHGFTHLLTMVDRTRRPEVVPLSLTTTTDVVRAFISPRWPILARRQTSLLKEMCSLHPNCRQRWPWGSSCIIRRRTIHRLKGCVRGFIAP